MYAGITHELANGLYSNLDWISYTFDPSIDMQHVLAFLGYTMFDLEMCERGAFGYKKMLKLSQANIRLLYDGNPDMGIHIDVSGAAINTFLYCFEMSRTGDTPFGPGFEVDDLDYDHDILIIMFSKMLDMGHFTRLDLAIDDVGAKFYTLKMLHKINKQLAYVCKCKSWEEIISNDTATGQVTGHTAYVGKRSSDIFMRIYDKQLEQNDKRHRSGVQLITEPWVRWEIELHRDNCNNAVKLLVSGMSLPELTIGILSNYIRFINLDNERKTRCTTSARWLRFLDGIAKARIAKHKQDLDIDRKKAWIEKQCARSLAVVVDADGGSKDFIEEVIMKGHDKMTLKDERLVADYMGK